MPDAPPHTRRVLWVLAAAVLIPVVLLSIGPDPDVGSGPWQTAWHGAAYAALTVCLLFAAVWSPGRGRGPFPAGAALVVGGTIGVGVLIEVAQLAVGRDADPIDALANAIGAVVGYGLWRALHQRSTS
jgi:VanZ family protein